jgi:hypothetical protein
LNLVESSIAQVLKKRIPKAIDPLATPVFRRRCRYHTDATIMRLFKMARLGGGERAKPEKPYKCVLYNGLTAISKFS